MRALFESDYKNYNENGTVGRRPSVRGIIIKNRLIAMVHSLKYDYYKFSGGGIDEGESHEETLIREVREEAGLIVVPDSIREYGKVLRKEKGKIEDIFIQENYYYFCEAAETVSSQALDDYEAEEQFTLEWVRPEIAIDTKHNHDHFGKSTEIARHMFEREAKVLELLLQEGYF